MGDAAWAEIKTLYIDSSETVRAIAARYGIRDRLVYEKARAAGWPRRSTRSGPATDPAAIVRREKMKLETPKPPTPHAVRRRLYSVMMKKLENLEARMTSGEDRSPADHEREMREIGAMIQGFEKVAKVDADERGAGRRDEAPDAAALPDFARLRDEIAERLERLHARGAPQGGAGATE